MAEVASRMDFQVDFVEPDVLRRGDHEELRRIGVAVLDITRAAIRYAMFLGSLREAGIPVILIAESSIEIPLDLAGYRTLIYGNSLTDNHNLLRAFEGQLFDLQQRPENDPSGWPTNEKNNGVFISYSHADRAYLRRLLVHLSPLDRQGMVNVWSDEQIEIGDFWKEEIEAALDRARVAILLVSADFLASDFVIDNELPPLLTKAQAGGTKILPVIIKACRFVRDPQLQRFQAANDPTKPLACLAEHDQEEIYDRVAEAVENVMR
ncbi:toll/interleukin-1 receptor domain-containing protein [Streptomyces sp. ICN988]|uniref:toll/interleukin-1 receptor domain-containing protein n=1 Tax=Streptomyces sp. ICN988 TaxID=2983765 RepID=UPI0021E3AFE4|nr:toll/interleukin-1 receptor domain-containing protein [Streptomyces sp. ICN988]MCV2458374.1 toll/interleukin-1 receptor domain-containing protein [Streptomyces sp. ICN988]